MQRLKRWRQQVQQLKTEDAALRLHARGSAPADGWTRQGVKRAAKSIGLEPLRMGGAAPRLHYLGR
ncbi:hypothetical protein JYJ95_13255 [Corallococcus exiguus]|uniref:hypothetical protein n=1 Tax=Corallococcus exiguus TaxID=83462 RepID=UPI001A8DF2B1|nr:hypothetical protein [Corallococcus exiguus]MBN8467483.1 hypothetical protein [Corallococcus exiguus]